GNWRKAADSKVGARPNDSNCCRITSRFARRIFFVVTVDLLPRRILLRGSPSSRSHAFIASRTLVNLCDQFYFKAGSKRHLSNSEGAANVLPYISKDLSEKLRSPIGHQMLFGECWSAVHQHHQ